MPFFIRIHGSNAVTPYAHGSKGTRIEAPGGQVGEVCVNGVRAVFPTRDAAYSAALACHWNNQRFSLHVCQKGTGALVEDQEWTSCQEGYTETLLSR